MKPAILFVDDETSVLEGFRISQRSLCDVVTAQSGAEGLAALKANSGIAVVVSDMRMPEMDGATFLARVKTEYPDAVRVLLTGHADIEAASRAVNEGRIFRFLTKPCMPEELTKVLKSACEMHELLIAERVLLQKTLLGSLKVVVNVLGLSSPRAMGRANRLREKTREATEAMQHANGWGIEFAAVFSQLAGASLSEGLEDKLYRGTVLSAQEQQEVLGAIENVAEALGDIPRLGPIAETLTDLVQLIAGFTSGEGPAGEVSADARLLHALISMENLEARGKSGAEALAELRKSPESYGDDVLAVLEVTLRKQSEADDDGTCPVKALENGMILAEDLRTTDGVLLLPRGFELTQSTRNHIVQRFVHRLPERVRIHLAPAQSESSVEAKG